MATWADVARIALSLPETSEGSTFGNRAWKVAGKTFVWVRPLGKADIERWGPGAPTGPILGVRTDDLEMKDAMLGSGEPAFFTIPHFDGYAAVLVLLRKLSVARLRPVIEDAWLSQAPKKFAAEFLAARAGRARKRG